MRRSTASGRLGEYSVHYRKSWRACYLPPPQNFLRQVTMEALMFDIVIAEQLDLSILDEAAGALATGVHCGDDDEE